MFALYIRGVLGTQNANSKQELVSTAKVMDTAPARWIESPHSLQTKERERLKETHTHTHTQRQTDGSKETEDREHEKNKQMKTENQQQQPPGKEPTANQPATVRLLSVAFFCSCCYCYFCTPFFFFFFFYFFFFCCCQAAAKQREGSTQAPLNSWTAELSQREERREQREQRRESVHSNCN